ncbi:hypothetical protein GCM10025859_51830 [Alicyclobacillus fastidiosus]|nr:hypothetical protein GCM10025859_51830 [Alicyclobacillus fastidiosus]
MSNDSQSQFNRLLSLESESKILEEEALRLENEAERFRCEADRLKHSVRGLYVAIYELREQIRHTLRPAHLICGLSCLINTSSFLPYRPVTSLICIM